MGTSIALVEDDPQTRESLRTLLRAESGLECTGAFGSAEEALSAAAAPPEVMIVDINLPGMSGIEFVGRLKARSPAVRVLMLTTYEDRDAVFSSLRAGADGYLVKRHMATDLIRAIEDVKAGGTPMSAQVARKVIDHFRQQSPPTAPELAQLTDRERDILCLLANGYLYKEISTRLSISFDTVRTHVRNIYTKLRVQSRTEATLKYLGR